MCSQRLPKSSSWNSSVSDLKILLQGNLQWMNGKVEYEEILGKVTIFSVLFDKS